MGGSSPHMEPGQIAGLHAEVSGLPAPLSAGVTEQRLPELRVYSVATGERQVANTPSQSLAQTSTLCTPKHHYTVSEGETVIIKCK